MCADIQLHLFLLSKIHVVFDGVKNRGQFVAKEDRHDGRRSFVTAQTVVVAGAGGGDPHQVRIIVHSLNNCHQKYQKLDVLRRGAAGVQKVHAVVGDQRPVVVLAAAVDAFKRFFVEQTDQVVFLGNLFHDLHGELVVVGGYVGAGVDGGQLMLGRGHLVVLGLGQDAQLPQLLVQLLHKGGYPGLDGAEVVVLQLLALGGLGPEEGPAGEAQVPALLPQLGIHQEILLFRARSGAYPLYLRVSKQAQNAQRLSVQRLHGAQQRRLLVQRLTIVAAEGGGNAQCPVLDKRVGGGVPRGVAPCLKGGPQSAGWERGGIRLSSDQLFAGELHDDAAVRSG